MNREDTKVHPLISQHLVRIRVVVMVMRGINRGYYPVSRDLTPNSNKIDSNNRGKLLRNNNRGPNPPNRNNNARDNDEKKSTKYLLTLNINNNFIK